MTNETLTRIKRKLADMNIRAVADATGLSYPTVLKISKGDEDVTLKTLSKLEAYFKERSE